MHYSKVERFTKKMAGLYPILATADQRSWAKKTDRYSAHLVVFPHDKDSTKVMFWLLATPGAAPKGFVSIHEREKLLDGLLHPPRWRDQYECLVMQRKRGEQGRWSWRMQAPYLARMESSAKEAADSGTQAVNDLFIRLYRMPMTGGIRDQVQELQRSAQATWKKRRKSDPPEILFANLPVLTKVTVFGELTVDVLVKQMEQNDVLREQRKTEEAQTLLVSLDEKD